MGLNRDVGLVCGCEFGSILGGGVLLFVLVNLEVLHHLIYDGAGVVESQFVNRSAGLYELKVSFLEVVLEIIPCFLRRSGLFPHTDVVFENSLFVEDNECKVYYLTLVSFCPGR